MPLIASGGHGRARAQRRNGGLDRPAGQEGSSPGKSDIRDGPKVASQAGLADHAEHDFPLPAAGLNCAARAAREATGLGRADLVLHSSRNGTAAIEFDAIHADPQDPVQGLTLEQGSRTE